LLLRARNKAAGEEAATALAAEGIDARFIGIDVDPGFRPFLLCEYLGKIRFMRSVAGNPSVFSYHIYLP
jgi:hypothetical protein